MSVTILCARGSQPQSLAEVLADVAKNIFAVCRMQPAGTPLVVGLCGGRSVVGLLTALEAEAASQPADLLGRIQFFMADERLVPLDDEQSNFGGLKRQLFAALLARGAIAPGQLHPFITDTSLPDAGCARYAQALAACGGRFTVVVLGMGEDGHIAGLFPHHRALDETSAAFISFHDSPKPPAGRMTASLPLIEGADLSVVLALGEAKRAAWDRLQSPAVSAADCPAKFATRAADCLIVTDLA